MRLVSLSSRRFSVAFFLSTHCGFRSLSCSSSLTRGRKAFTRSISGETASCSSNTMDDVGERLRKENIRVILGSKSATRKQILKEMKIEYATISADIDEKAIRFEDPSRLVEALARAKAEAILERIRKAEEEEGAKEKRRTLLITCDQVVVFDGKIREKPETEEEARIFMRSYKENNPCSTVGSIRVTDVATGASASSVDVCTIHFKEISKEAMDFLINEGEVMWCAGGLMVEHEKVRPFVTKIDGSEDGVMGMDKEVCARLLREVF